ncbi:HAMP domain-containing protein [Bacterioplanes sanyensis]|uniref:HAMP domain-containing protein n=1 Tax=Bacterioplanes sanyensis TaxID=1249553 RepID=UPI0012FE4792|nr:HAMP domain-containing protein [Bacterioplanes sanyensis]
MFRLRLITTFSVAAALLITVVLASGYALTRLSHWQQSAANWHASSLQLSGQLSVLLQQAQHYKRNAPRDYESYNRDLVVFYQQFLHSIAATEQAVAVLQQHQQALANDNELLSLLNATELFQAQNLHAQWLQDWQSFEVALHDALGDPAEPRLEWGAEYILANIAPLQARRDSLQSAIASAQQRFEQGSQQGRLLAMSTLIVLVLVLLLLLALRVVRPIVRTAHACDRVASGEYGLQIDETGSTETRQLQHAFNQLSARAKLMLDLVRDIHQPTDTATKLNDIFDSGRSALGINWLGLIALDSSRIELTHSAPDALDAHWRHRHISPNKVFGQELQASFQQQWLSLDNIRQLAVSRHDERFLRELHKNTLASEVVGYPFRCPQHKQFILLFSTRQETGFSAEQSNLIRALVPLMADAILESFETNTTELTLPMASSH